jgi:Glycosyl hydrolases family 16
MRAYISICACVAIILTVRVILALMPSGQLPDPGTGMRWQMTFDDEFSGNSVDTSEWNGTYANLQWCSGESFPESCLQNYDGLRELHGVLALHGLITNRRTFANRRAAMNTGGLTAATAKFSQRYGYFEWRLKLPHDQDGEGDGLWPGAWALPIGKAAFGPLCTEGNEEVDVAEAVLGTRNMRQVHFTVHDYCRNAYSIAIPRIPGEDLSRDFHRYGLLWRNDGSAHGSVRAYFDGVPQGRPLVLDIRSKLWDNGIYLLNQLIPCPNDNKPFFGGSPCTAKTSDADPLEIDYVRVYTAVPSDLPH